MDNIESKFERVLRMLVLPMFPIISDVSVERRPVTHDMIVTYYVDRLDIEKDSVIRLKTHSIFKMMGFEKYDVWITYRLVE